MEVNWSIGRLGLEIGRCTSQTEAVFIAQYYELFRIELLGLLTVRGVRRRNP